MRFIILFVVIGPAVKQVYNTKDIRAHSGIEGIEKRLDGFSLLRSDGAISTVIFF